MAIILVTEKALDMLSPIGLIGRIETFTAQQGTDLSWIFTGRYLLEDPSLVLGGKPAPFWFGPHMGLGA
jgi:hypothetical protein